MASTMRPVLLRQTQLLSASRRLLGRNVGICSSSSSSSSSTTAPTARLLQSTTAFSILRHSSPFTPPLALAPRSAAALFSTSTKKSILPPGPQIIQGGVNDPQPVPKTSPLHGSYHWTAERALSIALIPLTVAPFAAGSLNPTTDAILVFTVILHSHLGFQACITDYFPTPKHSTLRKSADWLLNIATLLVCIGFYEFETNDVGITEGIKRIWHAGRNDATAGAADVSSLGHDGKLKHLK